MSRFKAFCASFMLSVIVLVGCRRPGLEGAIPVRGKVTYEGKPVTGGEIRYIPADTQAGRIARGKLNDHGEFELTSLKAGDGALPGDYTIVVLAESVGSGDDRAAEEESGADAAFASKMRYEKPANKGFRAASGDGPASQVPLRYTRPQESGLSDHVDDQHSGYKEFNLTAE